MRLVWVVIPLLLFGLFGIQESFSQECSMGNIVILKLSNNKPNCVSPTTSEKLVERGWGMMPIEPFTNHTDSCNVEPDPGLCKAAFEKYYFNSETLSCDNFIWGGCGGTVPFNLLSECQMQCESIHDLSSISVIDDSNQNIINDFDSDYAFHWIQDDTISGYEYSSHINKPLRIKFLDDVVIIPDISTAQKLQHDYGVLLSDENLKWKDDHSYAILETMKKIPQESRNYYQNQNLNLSKWILTDQHIDDDIRITNNDSVQIITISLDAFENANPKIVQIEDKRGKYFSQRLHHALVNFVTEGGNNKDAIEKILNERYGVSTVIPDYEKLTQNTTVESENSFQQFHSWEIIEIINMFEEMPDGFHSIDELQYLVRRADGVPHPLYPEAPAVAWSFLNPGYIEFMESAFRVDDSYLHRLIIHEKSHFMWEHLFSDQLKNNWILLGNWYEDNSDSGWSTSKTTEFVSSYAHAINPDEDMAESIAYFVTNPDKLKSSSLEKYEFIRDKIMQGSIYISQIREDLTFDVYNLSPDYIYPGKITNVDIQVDGKENENKNVTITIGLKATNSFEGAKHAYLRLFSEIGTFEDVYLYPVDGTLGSVLSGQLVIDVNAKNGFWYTDQIVLTDQNGNQRFEGQNDFGWKLFVNNSDEDVIPPNYVFSTLKLDKTKDNSKYSKPIEILSVSWQVDENRQMKNCFVRIAHEDLESYSMDSWGTFDNLKQTCNVEFELTEYNQSGLYSVMYFLMEDMAGNQQSVDFTEFSEENHSIMITTDNPDVIVPYLDVNDITITAIPTNPQTPNGETHVNIVYFASDDKSGLGLVSYTLRDPQGIDHFNYHYHENFYTLFFDGIPNNLKKYEIDLILPEGSPPGKWGLTQMNLVDKANNQKSYQFTEIIHFDVAN
ncbi:hypothetical protein C6989_03395 [Nitrosopumilus sp. b2]|nr:hypothetical protein C6989_03395 [Nitrosopumilus sp. b2]